MELLDHRRHQRSKVMARRLYERVIRAGVEHATLCDGVDRYMAHCRANAIVPRYIKHPDTWLMKGCWDDEYPAPPKPETEAESR